MKVVTLVTIHSPAVAKTGTLFLSTIRTGFPTAEIFVYDNASIEPYASDLLCGHDELNLRCIRHFNRRHHARWIEQMVHDHCGELIIIDPDVIFWSSCEEWKWPQTIFPIGGFHIPDHWSEYANCLYASRLHTSFLWIKSTEVLRTEIAKKDLWPKCPIPDYFPQDLFMNQINYINGTPVFHDTCANLYHALGGWCFDETHLNCYDHLNCGSFLPWVENRFKQKEAFREVHRLAIEDPQKLKGYWREIKNYYNELTQRKPL